MKITEDNGDIYEGDVKRSFFKTLRHGKGKCTYAGGDMYEGDWLKDMWHGSGTFTYTDGSVYKGGFINNKLHGKGVKSGPGVADIEFEYDHGEMVSSRELPNRKEAFADEFTSPGNTDGGGWDIGEPLIAANHSDTDEARDEDAPMADISFIEQLLSEGPIINDDQNMLGEYVAFIHNDLDRVQKGSNFGSAILAAAYLQGMEAHAGNYDKLNLLSAEANNRMFAHFLYLKEIHSLQVREEAVKYNLNALLVNMACEIVETFSGNAESELVELGIKGVAYISSNILE